MDIKDRKSFTEFFEKLKSNPKFYLQHSNSLIPKCWHLSYYNQSEKNRDIYTLYWKSTVIAKVKINRNTSDVDAKIYNDGVDFFLKNTLTQAA
tara:strand:- start:381 stop:659 length:279 start_codon:yes stop_codon:yes gene_type:complete